VLSYYNQPDHPLIDRRDRAALALLLRLAAAKTQPATPRAAEPTPAAEADPWRSALAARGLPDPDPTPLDAEAGDSLPGWRDHFVAAALSGAPADAQQRLADVGFALVGFGEPATWPAAFDRLAALLGVAS
jgi:hypothetical protein